MQTDIVHTTRIHVLGIDLAKNSFSLHGVNAHGKCVLSKSLSRAKLAVFVTQLPPCLIGMEPVHRLRRYVGDQTLYFPALLNEQMNFVPPSSNAGRNTRIRAARF